MAGSTPSAQAEARRLSAPWRGPGDDRPDLPVPPEPMPILSRGQLRKQWRYVGFYGEEVMLCAAAVRIGPFAHTFWSVWDRSGGHGDGPVFEHTRLRPGAPEVEMDGPRIAVRAPEVTATLEFGECEPVEVFSPSGRAWGWTRKRAGVPVHGRIETTGGQVFEVDGFGVDDESAGYHARHTAWFWSAGVGLGAGGERLGWNLVQGINDAPSASERAIWVDGVPREPGPVEFSGLDSVRFEGEPDAGLVFRFGGAERFRRDNFGLIRSRYVHRFGEFSGSLDGIELASAAGVMEEHRVTW